MQNQLHIIELNLGKSSQMATALTAMMTPPKRTTSVFGAISSSIGQTATGAENQLTNNPAILSLFT